MTSLARKTALLAGALTLSFAAAALAAPSATPADPAPRVERRVIMMRGGPDGPGGPMMNHGMMGGPERPAMDPAKRAQHLRDVLQLRADQETALQAFLDATKPPEGPPMAMGGPDDDEDDDAPDMPATTPERLDQHLKMMNEHMAAVQKRIAAIKTFYGQLTPAQRKAFDALHLDRPMGGGRRRMMMMRHGGPMMDGPPPAAGEAHDHH